MTASPYFVPDDLHFFNEGTHHALYQRLGAQILPNGNVHFAVWAPNARHVSVVGTFNDWDATQTPMARVASSGLWEGASAIAKPGDLYKFALTSESATVFLKSDPFAFLSETPPNTASVIDSTQYRWGDAAWMTSRQNSCARPMAIYELHLGSWLRNTDGSFLTYREIAPRLVDYIRELGFTHVEFLPLTEHPFYGSWGYQVTGYFAPTRRYGVPEDLMFLIDTLHRANIGVIFDWVPAHFPNDAHGLALFDGTHLYEHADPRLGQHPDWKTSIFNYGRHEVRSFLLSSACFWLDRYHVDGLRVDGVASMLYRDYSRKEGEWLANRYGGRENLEAVDFLKAFNDTVHATFPGAFTCAEESTAWPGVTAPTSAGGLGFDLKWDMGWMHDSLKFFARDPIHRAHHFNEITFRGLYAFSENYILPLSHDEVVHGKGSLMRKMPGDNWQQRANVRLLLCYQLIQPGKKLLFMGDEFAQWNEWNHDQTLDWHLLQSAGHSQIRTLVADLLHLYLRLDSLHADSDSRGFRFIDTADREKSILSILRTNPGTNHTVVAVFNFTPVPRYNYRIGVPCSGFWSEEINTDSHRYGGGNIGNLRGVEAEHVPMHDFATSVALTLPPLAGLILTLHRAP